MKEPSIYHPISHDWGIIHRIVSLSHLITGVSFHCVDSSTFTLFYYSYMIRCSIMIPVKKDDHSGCRGCSTTLPLILSLKPGHSVTAQWELWNIPTCYQTAFVRTPAHKTGTPFYPAVKSIPAPELLTATVSKLPHCNRYDLLISKQTRKQAATGIIPHHMGNVFRISVTAPSMRSCLLLWKLQGIGFCITASLQCPSYVAISIVISLSCKS